MALDQGQLLGGPEGLSCREDGDLGDRVDVRGQRGDDGVPRLVHGDGMLLLGEEHVGPRAAPERDAVPGVVEILGGQDLPPISDGVDGGFVGEVGQIRTRRIPRGLAPCAAGSQGPRLGDSSGPRPCIRCAEGGAMRVGGVFAPFAERAVARARPPRMRPVRYPAVS